MSEERTRVCTECGTEYDNWNDAVIDDDCEGAAYLPPGDCDCWKCTEPEYREDSKGREYLVNNMEFHTHGESCGVCGMEKTEYKDLGTKGRYVCPNQREHHRNGEYA